MPKATLEFDLSDPYERDEHHNALHGSRYRSVLFEFYSFLRRFDKGDKEHLTTEEIREQLREPLDDLPD